jgi:tellurite resistance protein TerC
VTPISYWLAFHIALLTLLAFEYLMAHRVRDTRRKAIFATILWVTASLSLAALLIPRFHVAGSLQYLAGYAMEQALSIDNLFVFLLIFRLFQIPSERQPRVLFWGVAGAIVMRGAFIAAGVGLLERFRWISYVFAAILLMAAVRLLFPGIEEQQKPPRWLEWVRSISPVSLRQDAFFVRENGRRMVTVLMLALIAVELSDILFAVDSIPAVLSITRIPFIAYTSNIMAVMGLRSLYVLLAAMLSRLRFVHFGLAALLAFAAIKMLISPWVEIGPLTSLAVIAIILTLTVTLSLIFCKTQNSHLAPRSS